MKKTAYLLMTFIFFISFQTLSQTTDLQGTVNFGPLARVYKIITVPNCPQTYTPPAGTATTITHEKKYTNEKVEIKVESTIAPAGTPLFINANQEIRVPIFPHSEGKANFYLDDKDKSILKVNYFLNPTNTVPSGTTIREYDPVFSCAGVVAMNLRATRTLAADEGFLFEKVFPGSTETNTTWFAISQRIEVLNAAGGIAYYLVNHLDRNGKYILELQNREHIPFNHPSLDFGALTIPFKYRFGFTKNTIKIPDDVTASFNVGVYAGYKLTRYSIINKAGTYTNRTFFSLRVGPFLNLSSTTLDSISTTVGKVPMKKDIKQNIGVLSTGLGLMGDFKGVQLGIYLGWDFGMGSEAGNWNYHKRKWLGFGLGYKITDLFAKKD
jgi:hypothetical protein